MQYILIGNFGNHSCATLQYLLEQHLRPLHFIQVDTGWASFTWPTRVAQCSRYAQEQGISVHPLQATASFSDMVQDRKQFPSQKFQWCAGFLKGLAILNHLDQLDPFCEALVISGKRRQDSRRFSQLEEYQENNEYYNGRTVWHPLWQTDNTEFKALIERSGLDFLPHPSQECYPCIHSSAQDLKTLEATARERLQHLEQQIGKPMFEQPMANHINKKPASAGLQQFDSGCGSPWGCGE